ncbi:MAG: hypothetical protein ACKPKO_44420, partial [Candidatus Fonsibacter sp.]
PQRDSRSTNQSQEVVLVAPSVGLLAVSTLVGSTNAVLESSFVDLMNCSVNTVLLSSYTMSPWSTDNEIADEPEGLLVIGA